MRTFPCRCGNTLFFNSTRCVKCDCETGLCPCCHDVVPVITEGDIQRCGNPRCNTQKPVTKCVNYQTNQVCNCLVSVDAKDQPAKLCDYCALTTVIPDLSVEGNLEKWRRLEAAKRRVMYMMDVVGFPFRPTGQDQRDDQMGRPTLSFELKADAEQPVSTGHDQGKITINIREADSVERERTRLQFAEPQRTLVGHFRHELGHYVWDRLIKDKCEAEFRSYFGDERQPTYADALKQYYDNGPPADWQQQYISAYATMHPWEDFAESFGTYLDMVSVLDTAHHYRAIDNDLNDLDAMIADYQQVGLLANEFNRDMGLLDLVPEVLVPPVIEKLRFIHDLRHGTRKRATTKRMENPVVEVAE